MSKIRFSSKSKKKKKQKIPEMKQKSKSWKCLPYITPDFPTFTFFFLSLYLFIYYYFYANPSRKFQNYSLKCTFSTKLLFCDKQPFCCSGKKILQLKTSETLQHWRHVGQRGLNWLGKVACSDITQMLQPQLVSARGNQAYCQQPLLLSREKLAMCVPDKYCQAASRSPVQDSPEDTPVLFSFLLQLASLGLCELCPPSISAT